MSSAAVEIKRFKTGDIIFSEGDTGEEAYLIRSGFVSVTRREDGRDVALGTRSEGEIIGEMALIDSTVRSATVVASQDVDVEVISMDNLEARLEGAPETLKVILYQLVESLRCANDLIGMYASRLSTKDS